jgi:hypothetical protein
MTDDLTAYTCGRIGAWRTMPRIKEKPSKIVSSLDFRRIDNSECAGYTKAGIVVNERTDNIGSLPNEGRQELDPLAYALCSMN